MEHLPYGQNIHASKAIHEMLKGIDYLFAEIGGDQLRDPLVSVA